MRAPKRQRGTWLTWPIIPLSKLSPSRRMLSWLECRPYPWLLNQNHVPLHLWKTLMIFRGVHCVAIGGLYSDRQWQAPYAWAHHAHKSQHNAMLAHRCQVCCYSLYMISFKVQLGAFLRRDCPQASCACSHPSPRTPRLAVVACTATLSAVQISSGSTQDL